MASPENSLYSIYCDDVNGLCYIRRPKKSDCVPRYNFIVNLCFTVKRLIAKYRHGQCLISLEYLYLLCVAVLLAHKCYLGQFNPRESQEVNQRLPKSIVGGFTCAHKDYFVLYKESLDERQKGLPSLLAYLTHEANLRIKNNSAVTSPVRSSGHEHSTPISPCS